MIRSSHVQFAAALFVSAAVLSACEQTSEKPPEVVVMTQLETRQLQTREYEDNDLIAGMKAVISAFQDEGYLINSANEILGVVTASFDVKSKIDEATKRYVEDWTYNATYQTITRYEISASVSERNRGLRIRVNIAKKALNQNGGVIWSVPVQEPTFYQTLFSKIDKSLFLAREKI